MLTNNDYRAALLQAFRALRHESTLRAGRPYMGKADAYRKARDLIKPLPDDFETCCLREALEIHNLRRVNYFHGTPIKQQWHFAWQLARLTLKGY